MDTDGKLANLVYLDEDHFIRILYQGDLTERLAEDVYERLSSIAQKLSDEGRAINILADIRKMGDHTHGSRRVGLKIRQTVPFRKMAIVVSGKNTYAAKISEIITSISKRKKEIAYFKSETQAIDWLKQ